ncbi:YkyB family protein, partial [Bacillus licheniformis]|uniref:YkyB family protein n=1 Tax=Bacillus licheniformis TaxID=1402 RepID=UPI00210C9350
NLSKSIYTVNRHSKTETNHKYLYILKNKALQKLLNEGKGKKVCLHFSKNPRFSQHQSDVLISLGDYFFHIRPT